MASRSKLKTAFKKARVIAPLHTGGPVAVTADGQRLVTCVGEEAILTDLGQGLEICRFVGDTESITALCVTPNGKHLCLFTAAMALRIYDLPPASAPPQDKPVHPVRVLARAHDAPVHVCAADPTGTYLAAGGADGSVRVWDVARGFATHVLRGHGGVVSALAFSFPPRADVGARVLRLVTGSVDTRVRVWELGRAAAEARSGKGAKPEAVLEGHVSVPRGVAVSADGRWVVTGGRDAVVLVWDMWGKKGKGKQKEGEEEVRPVLVNTVPVLERVEAVGILEESEVVAGAEAAPGNLRFYTAGEKGVVRIWDAKEGSVLCTFGVEQKEPSSDDQEEQRQILDAIYTPTTHTILSIHADQNLLFHSLPSGTLARQLIGFNDEIIDAAFLRAPDSETDTHLALATNSSLIRLYSTASLDARLLAGHKDIVLALAARTDGRMLGSGGKDRAARLWAPAAAAPSEWACVAVCEGHAESVGALAFARAGAFVFTGSQDRTIKMWDLSGVPEEARAGAEAVRCKSLCTHKAHEKDINALDVAPNDALLASGSQDRTAKVFGITYGGGGGEAGARGELKLLGTCRGHKRGVWSVRFAAHERVLATGGGDRTVRLWGLERFECVRVLEGHGNSVLRVAWLAQAQLASAGADGLVKVWDTRAEECVATLDGHEDKVWALAVARDGRSIVSGAADSRVVFWEDCTEEEEARREEERAQEVLQEQDFLNYVALADYRRAIELALSLGHPGRLYTLFKDLASSAPEDATSLTGHPAVDAVLAGLHPTDLARLLGYVRTWNARAKTAGVAQRVLHAVVKLRGADEILAALGGGDEARAPLANGVDGAIGGEKKGETGGPKALLDALVPYTERHLARMERLVAESYVVDLVLGEMDMFMDEEAEEGMDVDA